MRTATLLAGLVLVMGGLVGCGGSDGDSDGDSAGMPTNASKEEFCGNFQSLSDDLGELDPDSEASEAIKALHSAAGDMRSTGTPEDIPADARHGLEVTLDAITALPEDADAEDIGKLEDSLSEADQKDSDAFDSYLSDECPDLS
ncbi:MAG TPA: hypothetical protein VFT70_07580 [Nocardioides sp.]|nr:hypothetical protein [Nocardioides sp.]